MVRVIAKRRPLPQWIEDTVRLPAASAEPGPIKLYPYQRGIAAAIGDPKVERVNVLKKARVGYAALLTGALAHFVVREPSPILVLMPSEADCPRLHGQRYRHRSFGRGLPSFVLAEKRAPRGGIRDFPLTNYRQAKLATNTLTVAMKGKLSCCMGRIHDAR